MPIYGGQPIGRQLQALDRGVHVVVATPGRALDHIGRGSLQLDSIRTVVLDEADEMLDMGFADDIERSSQATPERAPDRAVLGHHAAAHQRDRQAATSAIRCASRSAAATPTPGTALVRQSAYVVQRAHKPAALGRILDIEAPKAALVFCRTRTEVDQLTETMNGRGYRAEALHGGMDQDQRDRVMGRLRDGTAELLVATDVAARGLDVDTLTHVVNYDVPSAPESYVHRIGRVGRAGREGVAITLAEPREQRLLLNIERLTKQKIAIERVPDGGRPARSPDRADGRGRPRGAGGGRPRRLQRRAQRPGRRPQHPHDRPGRCEAGPRGRRRNTRRSRDPRLLTQGRPQSASRTVPTGPATRVRDRRQAIAVAEPSEPGSSTSESVARAAFVPATSSASSPTRAISAVARSARSRSPSSSRSSACPRDESTT